MNCTACTKRSCRSAIACGAEAESTTILSERYHEAENQAIVQAAVTDWLRAQGTRVSAVSCTVGGFEQCQINDTSSKCGVSCNPLGQAAQLESEGVELAIQFGLCMGHDILFARTFKGDQTVLWVKERKPLLDFQR